MSESTSTPGPLDGLDADKAWDEREQQYKMSGEFVKTRAFVQTAEGDKNGMWTSVISAVMLIPDGTRIDWTGEYTEVDRPNRLAFTLSDDPGQPAGVPIVATFTAVDGGTEVSITQDRGTFDDAQVQATVDGYNQFFDSMERVVATLAAPPVE